MLAALSSFCAPAARFQHDPTYSQLFNGATIAECVYNLAEKRDLPVTLKPFPTYSKAIDVTTTQLFTIAYAVISGMAVGADIVLLAGVKKQPVKALTVFLYWNVFHFLADVVIIMAFFVAVLNKQPVKALTVFLYWNVFHFLADVVIIMAFFIAVLNKLSILGSVYQTYKQYVANPNYRESY
ncbi:hypothetical protein HPB50_014411 [Hyalomma asiaticum]|uniref:Uncharacterized protein n=1 Tax=Hyalomma asiaticum TaxID=266040 RepID=A0ACB7SYH1_HYAAI|nr:hypothetical protein HPB50_014411 [Hyalomma asiaticum]